MATEVLRKAMIWLLDPLLTGAVKLCLIDTTIHPDSVNDDFLDDISDAVIATSPELTGKTVTVDEDGKVWFKADNTKYTSVTGNRARRQYLYIDTGNPASSRLIARHDVDITPNGADIGVVFNVSGILGISNTSE